MLTNIDRDNIRANKNALCCYQWRLPKYNSLQIELLCSGYIRQESNIFIPLDIIAIFAYYVNTNIVDEIKASNDGDVFQSGIFEYKSCIFNFSLYPREKKSLAVVALLDAPKYMKEVTIAYTLQFMEKFIERDEQYPFSCRRPRNHSFLDVSYDDLRYLDSITFNLIFLRFSVMDYKNQEIFAHGNVADDDETYETEQKYKYIKPTIINERMCQSKNTDIFIWNLSKQEIEEIKISKPKDVIMSEIFMMHKMKYQIFL